MVIRVPGPVVGRKSTGQTFIESLIDFGGVLVDYQEAVRTEEGRRGREAFGRKLGTVRQDIERRLGAVEGIEVLSGVTKEEYAQTYASTRNGVLDQVSEEVLLGVSNEYEREMWYSWLGEVAGRKFEQHYAQGQDIWLQNYRAGLGLSLEGLVGRLVVGDGVYEQERRHLSEEMQVRATADVLSPTELRRTRDHWERALVRAEIDRLRRTRQFEQGLRFLSGQKLLSTEEVREYGVVLRVGLQRSLDLSYDLESRRRLLGEEGDEEFDGVGYVRFYEGMGRGDEARRKVRELQQYTDIGILLNLGMSSVEGEEFLSRLRGKGTPSTTTQQTRTT